MTRIKKYLAVVLALCLMICGMDFTAATALAAPGGSGTGNQALKDGQAEDYNSNQYYHIDILVDANYDYTLTFSQDDVVDHADMVIKKTWDVTAAQEANLPSSIDVTIIGKTAAGREAYNGTVTLTAAGSWTKSVSNLPIYDSYGDKITYTVKEDAATLSKYYGVVEVEIDSSITEGATADQMVYTEGTQTIVFDYGTNAPYMKINSSEYAKSSWTLNEDGTYTKVFTYTDSGLEYDSTWIYNPTTKKYTYISHDYMKVTGINYVTYTNVNEQEVILYDAGNYVTSTSTVADGKARNYYYYIEQADAYRDENHYSQEFWSTDRAIADMPAPDYNDGTVIRVGYGYQYVFYDKFGVKTTQNVASAEQVFDTGSSEYKNICEQQGLTSTMRGYDVVLQLSEAVFYYGDGPKDTYNVNITNTPVGSLTVSKEISGTAPAGDEFTFEIDLGAFNDESLTGSFSAVLTSADGSETNTTVTFDSVSGVAESTATVKLEAGESITINGIPQGVSYTVTEKVPSKYSLLSAAGTEGTISENDSTAEFVNQYLYTGNLLIGKEVLHPYGSEYTLPDDQMFTVKVSLGQAYAANMEFAYAYALDGVVPTDITNTIKADANGDLYFNLRSGEEVIIYGIRTGKTVTVVETVSGTGFTATYKVNGTNVETATVTIGQETTQNVLVENTYVPESVSPTIELSGYKTFENGTQWPNDGFEVQLQRHNGTAWATIATAYMTDTNGTAAAIEKFNEALAAEEYTTIGTYSYQIFETNAGKVVDGTTYDATVHTFAVVVTDNDMDGALEISNVISEHTGNAFTYVNGTWSNDQINFTNVYNARDARIYIDIEKDVVVSSGSTAYGKDGFEFELVDKDGNVVAVSEKTDAVGEARLFYTYTHEMISDDFNGRGSVEYTYKLREKTPSDTGNWEYDDRVYEVEVTVEDNGDGTMSASAVVVGAENNIPVFTNTYNVRSAEFTLELDKVLVNNHIANYAEKFEFVLTEVNLDGSEKEGGAVLEAVNDASGNVTFDTIQYDTIGDYYYKVTETDTGIDSIVYDEAVYYVHVHVSDNGTGELTARYQVSGSSSNEIHFVNTYYTTFVPAAQKVLADEDGNEMTLTANRFTFGLLEVTEDNEIVVGGSHMTATNDADGNVVFDEIIYEEAGTYYYIMHEIAGEEDYIRYDETLYRYTVVVEEIESVLVATIEVEEPVVFTNTYVPVPTTANIAGTKTLNGRHTLEDETFVFEITAAEDYEDVYFPLDKDGNEIHTADVTQIKDGATKGFLFQAIEFKAAGTYKFEVREVIPSEKAEGMTYDEAVITVEVVVQDIDNALAVTSVTYTKDGKSLESADFVNTYEEVKEEEKENEVPVTGDSLDLMKWFMMAAGSVMILVMAAKRKDENA